MELKSLALKPVTLLAALTTETKSSPIYSAKALKTTCCSKTVQKPINTSKKIVSIWERGGVI
ncbi:MAG: hypothetical protein AB1485_05925 [Candidatus Thermoplasmatota archaeon]